MGKEKLPPEEICQIREVRIIKHKGGGIEYRKYRKICGYPVVGAARVEEYAPLKTWPFEYEFVSYLQGMCDYHLMMWAVDHDDPEITDENCP